MLHEKYGVYRTVTATKFSALVHRGSPETHAAIFDYKLSIYYTTFWAYGDD